MRENRTSGKKRYRFLSGLVAMLTAVGMVSAVCMTASASPYAETGSAVSVNEDTSSSRQTGTAPAIVVSSSDVDVFSISDESIEIGKNLTAVLTASGNDIQWSSSNTDIATVDENGVVKGIKVGNCVITATDANGNSADCKVKVKKVCYITFDDGPNKCTADLLAMLKKYDVKATFFVVYKSKYFYLTKEMQAQGHLVGLHTYTHDYDVCYKTQYSYFEGLEKLADAVEKYTGTRPYVIRFPGGSSNKVSNSLTMKRITVGAKDLGYRAFDWTASAKDASSGASTAQSIKYVKKTCTEDVEILLMHDKTFNVKALDTILPYLKSKGYIFETLDKNPNAYTFKTAYTKTTKSTNVTVNKSSADVYEGNSFTLTAKITPSKSTDFVRWESSDTSVASVNVSGKVTGVKQGTAVITAVTSSGKTATCTVNVKIPAKKVTLNKTSHKMCVGESVNLDAVISPENSQDTVKWTTSNAKVAKVDSNGNVVAKAKGKVTITAKTKSGVKATCVVNVIKPTTTLKITNADGSLYVGNTRKLKVKVTSGSNDPITWKSDNTAVATVSSSGTVKAVSQGYANITATTFSGKEVTVKVSVRTKANKIVLDCTSKKLFVGDTFTINADITSPENCNDLIKWKSSNTKAVSILPSSDRKSAEITVKKKGSYTITVTTGSGKSVSCKITSIQATKTIKLNKTSASVYVGKTLKLTATLSKNSNDPVSWTTSDKSIAKVNSKGQVTAVSAGTATITATTFSGKSVSCKVTVRTKATKVSLDQTSITAKKGDVVVLNAEIISPENCNDTLTWTTSSKSKAKIQKTENNSAEISIVGRGSVVIKVKTGSGKYAQCKITCK